MTEIHGIITGVDGTLVRYDRNVPSPSVVRAAQQLHVPVIPVTEHSVLRVASLAGLLNLRSFAVAEAGATIWNCTRSEVSHSQWLQPTTVWDVAEALGHYCTDIFYRTPHGSIHAQPRGNQLEHVASIIGEHRSEKTQSVSGALSDIPDIQHTHKSWGHQSAVHVLRSDVVLRSSIRASLQYEQLTNEAALVAIAGAAEDGVLFETIGTQGVKIALESAPPQLQEAADIVVAGAENDGFVQALHAVKLISA